MSVIQDERTIPVALNGHAYAVIDHPVMARAVREFTDGSEDATLQFFDATLPACRRLIDVGAYVGLLSLYAADRVEAMTSFEPSPTNHAFLEANLSANLALARRINVEHVALGPDDCAATLFRKGYADSGSSLLRTVERQTVLQGVPEAAVPVRRAAAALEEAGLDRQTLLNIDIEGMEYALVPSIAGLLAKHLPFLHLSFHPFNLVDPAGPVETTLLRLRHALDLAAVLLAYDFWYFREPDGWRVVGPAGREAFIEHVLLRRKPPPRIATPQYGFVDAMGFAREALPALNATPAAC